MTEILPDDIKYDLHDDLAAMSALSENPLRFYVEAEENDVNSPLEILGCIITHVEAPDARCGCFGTAHGAILYIHTTRRDEVRARVRELLGLDSEAAGDAA